MGSSSERRAGCDGDDRPERAAHPLSALDRPAWTLIRDLPEVLAPVRIVGPEGPTVPLFRDEASALAHLHGLPPDAPPVRLLPLPADDWRLKEEWLTAAALAGSRWVAVDPPVDRSAGAGPAARTSVDRASAYVASFKRGTACL